MNLIYNVRCSPKDYKVRECDFSTKLNWGHWSLNGD